MNIKQVQNLLLRKAKKSGTIYAWCRDNGVSRQRASEFLSGKRLPTNDILEALGLEWRIVRKKPSDEDRYLSEGWVHFNPQKSP